MRIPDENTAERRESEDMIQTFFVPFLLKDVSFTAKERRKGPKEWRIDGTDDHKIIILDSSQDIEPEEGKNYTVEIMLDTRPGERKGKLIGRIIAEDGVPMEVKIKREFPLPIEIDRKEGVVYVLDNEIPFNAEGGPLVPEMRKFEHFTLDEHTLKILKKVATAIELNKPLLLEGETAATKTSAIEYMASVTNNEVVRINMSGHTDTSELIGKFVPNDGEVQLEFEKLLQHVDSLSPKTQKIVQAARKEARPLSKTEAQMIASEEGIQVAEWRWQDGAVPRAMKTGAWLIIDELTLADPSVRERLNSVLERDPSLLMSENGGLTIGTGGDFEVHPNFRRFATTNPAEYGGRIPLTPAEKRRWTGFMSVPIPGEDSFKAMLNFITYGEAPMVEIDGEIYQGDDVTPKYKKLKRVPNFRETITRLTQFHVKLEQMARDKTIGKDRKSKYVFTRDNLLTLLDFLENKTLHIRREGKRIGIEHDPDKILRRALQETYTDFLVGDKDKQLVIDQLTVAGLPM